MEWYGNRHIGPTSQDYPHGAFGNGASRARREEKDAAVGRRLLALALVLEGHSRDAAARINGMDRQTLQDWVHRYNAGGIAGLRSDAGGGPEPLLNASQMEELRAIVIKGPEPERHRVVRWRRADLCREIARRWLVRVCSKPLADGYVSLR